MSQPRGKQKKLKVIHVITHLDIGGAQDNTLLSVEKMDRDRFASILVSSPGGGFSQRAGSFGGRMVTIPSMKREISPLDDIKTFTFLVDLFTGERPDIVHTHGSKAGILGRFAARAAAAAVGDTSGVVGAVVRAPRIVHTVHSFPFHPGLPRPLFYLYLCAEVAAARLTHRLVFVSARQARQAEALGIKSPGGSEIIRSGIDFERIRSGAGRDVRGELGVPAGVPLVGSVGRLFPQKAPEVFLEAARILRERGRDMYFVYAGDGPLRERIELLRRQFGLDDVFHLLGWRSDVPAILDALDAFVISSKYEGVGRALTEALYLAKPVVATAVCGVPELVVDGETGLLVPPDDPGALASAIERVMDDQVLARTLGGNGSARVTAEYSAEEMIRRLAALYTEITG